jgi:ABC-2 type transport system permease protein
MLMPLTHLVDAARDIMIDGAGVLDVLPQLGLLLGARGPAARGCRALFRWE